MIHAVGVIPARYASTRFPGKPLAPLGGRTLVEEVWIRASAAKKLERVIIATDDRRIADAAGAFGAEVRLTSGDHPSGTDRVAEVVASLDRPCDVVVNIQGDEALVTPSSLDRLVSAFEQPPPPEIATLAEPIERAEDLFDPNVVKVVVARDGRALYFSRSPIPYHRGDAVRLSPDFGEELRTRAGGLRGYRKHQGVYAYGPETVLALSRMEPSALETDEGLEQLRALEAGWTIKVLESDFRSQGVDTPADLERVEELLGETR